MVRTGTVNRVGFVGAQRKAYTFFEGTGDVVGQVAQFERAPDATAVIPDLGVVLPLVAIRARKIQLIGRNLVHDDRLPRGTVHERDIRYDESAHDVSPAFTGSRFEGPASLEAEKAHGRVVTALAPTAQPIR